MSSVAIPGSNIARATLIAAATNVPQRAEWVVQDGTFQPMTFVQHLDHFQGDTIGAVFDSAATRIASLDATRHRHRNIGLAGVGAAAVGGLMAALTPLTGVGIAVAVAGGLTANFGLVGARWDGDEIASTQDFANQLDDWGSVLSRQNPGSTPQP